MCGAVRCLVVGHWCLVFVVRCVLFVVVVWCVFVASLLLFGVCYCLLCVALDVRCSLFVAVG